MTVTIERRELLAALGGAVAAWPLATRAQQPAMSVIGFLNGASAGSWAPFVSTFRQGLGETGFAEGRNVAIEYRWADEQYDRLPALAADLVRRQPSVIVANHVSAAAAKTATATIPIVFTTAVDPVQLGLVASLARPSGNLTGVTTLNVELVPQRPELLHELSPTATPLALLVNPTSSDAETVASDTRAAARALGLDLHVVEATTDRDLETAFASLAQRRVGGLVIAPDPWVLGGSIIFPPPYGFLFGSKGGPDLVPGGFESSIVGSFVTDPRDYYQGEDVPAIGRVYKGRGRFQLGALTGAAGAVRISFYSLTGTYWGMLGSATLIRWPLGNST
jgi:ABC transporter substrate binding protein